VSIYYLLPSSDPQYSVYGKFRVTLNNTRIYTLEGAALSSWKVV